MDIHEKIDENTTLFYIEANNWHCDDKGNEVIDIYQLSFQFYDCWYMVYVRAENIAQDFPHLEMEGDSALFDSFLEACEDQHWELIKTKCKEYDKWYAEL